MRSSYPLISNEINDKLLMAYENLVYLLGYSEVGLTTYSGLYDGFDNTIDTIQISQSGIPSFASSRMLDFLKFDYIYRRPYGQIQYLENNDGR
jgi:hypothetical protein